MAESDVPLTRLHLAIRDRNGEPRLDLALIERLLADLAHAGDASIVTLGGSDRAFCEGMDLSALTAAGSDPARALERFAELLHVIETTPRPVIALVDGDARGGGVGLAAAADLVIASPRASFGLPEVLFGLIPAMVFPVLARRVGHAHARRLALGAASVTAREALALGLVDEVAADPESALVRHARRFARLDARAIAAVKAIAAEFGETRSELRKRAAARFGTLFASDETQARIHRFLAGDTPWPDDEAP